MALSRKDRFADFKIRYHPNSPLVIEGIMCTFEEGTRVGVVGRTGSRKITTISALFRLVETANGRLLIDGLDICSMGIKDLSLKPSIISQEAALVRGTARTSVGSLGLFSDPRDMGGLHKVHGNNHSSQSSHSHSHRH